MGLHRHTLLYRLKKIESITGRSLITRMIYFYSIFVSGFGCLAPTGDKRVDVRVKRKPGQSCSRFFVVLFYLRIRHKRFFVRPLLYDSLSISEIILS
nr:MULTISPECIES: helix-turn-helix domain-containing protein [unclassified Thermoactinomyces]